MGKNKIDFNKITIGDKDPLDRLVTNIYFSDEKYLIYDIEGSERLFHITEGVENEAGLIIPEVDKVISFIGQEKKVLYKSRFAKAYRECFEGRLDSANEILKNIKEDVQIERKNLENFKYTYIGVASIIFLVNCMISIAVLGFDMTFTNTIRDLFFMAAFGSLGGLISISRTVKNFSNEYYTRIIFHIIDAVYRILISMVSAIVLYYLIKADLLLGVVDSFDYSDALFFILAVVSGFSEHFVPSFIEIIDNRVQKNRDNLNNV